MMNSIYKGIIKIMMVGIAAPSLWSCSRMNTKMAQERENPHDPEIALTDRASRPTSNSATTSTPPLPSRLRSAIGELSEGLSITEKVEEIVEALRAIIAPDTLLDNKLKREGYKYITWGNAMMATAGIATMWQYGGHFPVDPLTDQELDQLMETYSRCIRQAMPDGRYVNAEESGAIAIRNSSNSFWLCEYNNHQTVYNLFREKHKLLYILRNHPSMIAIGLLGLAGLVCTVGGSICTLLPWAKSRRAQLGVSSTDRARQEAIANRLKEVEQLHRRSVDAYKRALENWHPDHVKRAQAMRSLKDLFIRIRALIYAISQGGYNASGEPLLRALSTLKDTIDISFNIHQRRNGSHWRMLSNCKVAVEDSLNYLEGYRQGRKRILLRLCNKFKQNTY